MTHRSTAIVVLFWGLSVAAAGDEIRFEDPYSSMEETFFFAGEETAYAATKREHKTANTPSSITVITADQIATSGATSIPELLRRVPGLHVAMVTRSDVNVSGRGFNDWTFSNTLLLIDGRSAYIDCYNVVLWDLVPVELDDIDRIEIVRDPGSSLWGVNAFDLVINVITKSPDQLAEEGSTVRLRAGNHRTSMGSLVHGGKLSTAWSYKATLGFERWAHFGNTSTGLSRDEREDGVRRGTLSLRYAPNEDSVLTLAAGVTYGSGDLRYAAEMDRRGSFEFAKLNWDLKGFRIQLYYNGYRQDTELIFGDSIPIEDDIYGTSLDLSLERSDTLEGGVFDGMILTYGLESRRNTIDTEELLQADEQQMLYSGFLQAEQRLVDEVTVTLGCRIDSQPEKSGSNLSPRIGVVYKPWNDHTFWGSCSYAYKSPSSILNFAQLTFDGTTEIAGIPFPVASRLNLSGNEDLDPQRKVTYQVGYRNTSYERLRFNIDLFLSRRSDLFKPVSTTDLSGLPFQVTMNSRFENQGRAASWGGEAGVECLITNRMTGYTNYSLVSIRGDGQGLSPRNQANAGLLIDLSGGFKIDAGVNYVEGSTLDGEVGQFLESSIDMSSDSYFLVNGSLLYEVPASGLAFSLSAFNLTHDEHVEIPMGEEIGTLVTLGVSYRF